MSLSLLLDVGVGRCALGVDLLLQPKYFYSLFLGSCAYELNSWLLECVFLLVCMGVGCCGFELRFLVYVLVGLWAWVGVGVGIGD